MKLKEIVEKLRLEIRSKVVNLDKDVAGGYISDLLSDVLSNACDGDLWITLQTHPNIIAVASMKGLAGIVMIGGREPEEETVKKAVEENMPIMRTKMSAFELAGKLHALGISGSKDNA